jgi:hypothetical protein
VNWKITVIIASNQPNFYKNGMKTKELRRRRFKLHWGGGWITEEARSRTVHPAFVVRFGGEIAALLLLPRRYISRRSVDSQRVSSGELETRDSKEQNDLLVDEKTCLKARDPQCN